MNPFPTGPITANLPTKQAPDLVRRDFTTNNLGRLLVDLRVAAHAGIRTARHERPISRPFEFGSTTAIAPPENPVETDDMTLSPEAQKLGLDQALERLDKHAESQLEMARLFIDRGKTEIARRRLHELLEMYGKSDAAKEAKKLLKRL